MLTNFPPDPLLDLDPWVGQRLATYRFALMNRVTGQHLGDIHPIREASLSHDTTRTIKRELTLPLGRADVAAINPISDRVAVYMVFPNRVEYPMGRYMFSDTSRHVFTSGRLGNYVLNDEMFLVDQNLTTGINGVGRASEAILLDALTGLPIVYTIQSPGFESVGAWGMGASRGSLINDVCLMGNYFTPWFDNLGIMRFINVFDPAVVVPDFDWDRGNQVNRASIMETDNLLTAPNTFIVTSNASKNTSSPVVGIAFTPSAAPHSVQNRGFTIAKVETLQVTDIAQAQRIARTMAITDTAFERVNISTAPDPRHDSYNVIFWRGTKWLELSWNLTLQAGAAMNHLLQRAYRNFE